MKELIADLKNTELSIEDKGRGEYYHSFIVTGDGPRIEMAYIQVTDDPLSVSKQVIKSDGSLAGIQGYGTETGSINGIQFEIQDSITEAADKIYKREHRGDPKKEKHEQDLFNLEQRFSIEAIEAKVEELRKR